MYVPPNDLVLNGGGYAGLNTLFLRFTIHLSNVPTRGFTISNYHGSWESLLAEMHRRVQSGAT